MSVWEGAEELHTRVQFQRPEEGTESPGVRGTVSCKGAENQKANPLQKQEGLLTTEPPP